MSWDLWALQNGLIPVHPFSSSFALGNEKTSDAYTVKAEHRPQHQFVWFPSVYPSPPTPLLDVSHPICPVVTLLRYPPLPPSLCLTFLSSLIFRTPRFAHFQSSRIFLIASLGFHVIQSIPAILQVLCMLPDCSSEIYHVTSIQRQISDREINANREICYLSLRFRKNLCTVFWNFERLFPSPSRSPSRLLLHLNLSFPLFPSITHHFLLLFSSHSFCFFSLFLILSSSLGQWEFRKRLSGLSQVWKV